MNKLEIYKSMILKRFDDNKTAYYFSEKDFSGLNKEEYSFYSKKGDKLKGYFYYYDNPKKDRLVVFEHGIGGGHRSYMREIELLCKNGFRVFAYDHSGCMESEGENAGGLTRSLQDLIDFLESFDANGIDISVIGHSWGGFSAMNIVPYYENIRSVVAISGCVSAKKMLETYFGADSEEIKTITELEKENNPAVYNRDSGETLLKSEVPTLLIYSDNDPVCDVSHYEYLKQKLKNKNNISFILENNKFHNPNYTKEAVSYLNEYYSALSSAKISSDEEKEKFVSSFNWHKMTEQDEEVWNKIIAFLFAN